MICSFQSKLYLFTYLGASYPCFSISIFGTIFYAGKLLRWGDCEIYIVCTESVLDRFVSWLFVLYRVNFCASIKIDHCQNIGPVAKLAYILILPWKQFCRLSSLREGFFFRREGKRTIYTRGKEDQGFRLLAPPCPHLVCQPAWSLLIIAVKEHGKEFCQHVIWKQWSLTSRCLLNNNEYSLYLLASSGLLFSDTMQVSLLVLISCFYLARPWESSVSLWKVKDSEYSLVLVYFSALYMYLYISSSQGNSNGRCYRQISVYIFCIINKCLSLSDCGS